MSLDFVQPIFYVDEALSISDVIHEDDSVGAFVVGGSDGFESER